MTSTLLDFMPLTDGKTGFFPLSVLALFEDAREAAPLAAMTMLARAPNGRIVIVCEPRRVDKNRQMATIKP